MRNDQTGWVRTSLLDEALKRLASINIGDARLNVEWMLCELLKCNRASLHAHPEAAVDEDVARQFLEMIARRRNHEPLQHILGYTAFCGLHITVTPDVLIPRPETELLVERATAFLETRTHPTVLDLGTGSGCIPLAIKHFDPRARVSGCDISPRALDVARENASRLALPVAFFACDILKQELPPGAQGPFDLMVSNPPYIPTPEYRSLDPEVRDFEPRQALDAGPDPLQYYRALTEMAGTYLLPGGLLLLETHCDYAHAVAALLEARGLANVAVTKDLAGRDRIVQANAP